MLRKILLVCALLIVAVLAARYWLRDEEAYLKQWLFDGAKAASFEGQIHPFERLAWAREISGYFGPSCSFVLVSSTDRREILRGSDELEKKLVVFRSALEQFALALLSPEIAISGSKATVTLTARGIGREPGRSDYFKEEHRLLLNLEKTGKEWRMVRVQNIDPYEGELTFEDE